VSAPRVAVVTVVHGRHDHLRRQQDGLRASARTPDVRCVVAIDDDPTDLLDDDVEVIPCDRTSRGLPLARARNLGAERAIALGADLVIFLDVDCIPGAAMIDRYAAAHAGVTRPALLAGPVTYLPPSEHGYPLAGLPDATNPHPARPNPPTGAVLEETNHDLFWSLSFATTPAVWRRIGGFCEEYVGYGAEDTDFATQAARRDVALYWVGGAHAYHQHHPVSNPPVEHLGDIVANAATFHRRWRRWPMPGWLDEFERRGLITRADDQISLTTPADAASALAKGPHPT
jgi:GT2 family glycosyltransferase